MIFGGLGNENKSMKEKNVTIYFSQQVHTDIQYETENCMQRNIPLTEGMSLYHALQKEGIGLAAPCAGNGTCGACKIKLLEGSLPITEKDKQLLSEKEIREGWRLACQAYVTEDCVVYVPTEQFVVLTGYGVNAVKFTKKEEKYAEFERDIAIGKEKVLEKKTAGTGLESDICKIAIDLGTTTIAYELFDAKTGDTIRTLSNTNSQRLYGADVVSRMDQSNNGRKEMLKNILRQQMRQDIAVLIGDMKIENIESIAISENTAMTHLFMGYSCEGLGKYPFTPETLDCIKTNALKVNLMDEMIPVVLTEGISAYVGGDIMAGFALQKFLSEKEVCLFIDLGTNAEMALSDGEGRIYVTSAPAGPAFEAANISCGVGSIEGAISSISIQKDEQELTVIGGKEPVGFCGSGILEVVYELLKNNLIDETGLLAEEYFDSGYPVGRLRITQQDIRQIQLAKSAVFSAIEILMKKAGISPEQIEQVYLAGGFGYYLNVEKAIGIGLLPQIFAGKIRAVGNASLQGTKELLLGRITEEELRDIKDACREVYLSNEAEFQNTFMENMNFRKVDME